MPITAGRRKYAREHPEKVEWLKDKKGKSWHA